ncbi:carboxylic ester hydrolase [Plakobranchus ocellatus]|uniref:Carboxylic ester hydrolase n=1 Tax=Plakobranchus ocellatus TaxID=259542 RepID=A0AAV4CAX9_9GAST|nr:carboxylic ester hydrolase [Plakobranchus ocellatus]
MFSAALLLACLGTLVPRSLCAPTEPGVRYVTTSTKHGVIRGQSSDQDGMVINNYFGIPYARPPMGALRFQSPVPANPWSGVRDALLPSRRCVQTFRVITIPQKDDVYNFVRCLPRNGESVPRDSRGLFSYSAIRPEIPLGYAKHFDCIFTFVTSSPQSEDCLYINVHAPAGLSRSVPVMVWIHGGGYRTGHGAPYNGERLAAKGVVMVSFNYRLDALGFLSMENDLMPGNYGMLDQVAALKWVKDNIASFGGDPQRVTIFGESAGSTSVSLLLLSPLARGLFQGAIMESGVSLAPFAYAHPARAISPRLAAHFISTTVGCASPSRLATFQCLQTVDAARLINASRDLVDQGNNGNLLMTPRVDGPNGFLPDLPLRYTLLPLLTFSPPKALWIDLAALLPNLPLRLLARGQFEHVNTIRGYNENEMGMFLNFTLRGQSSTADTFKGEVVKLALDQFTVVDKDQMIQGEKYYLYQFAVRPQQSTQPDWITAIHADEIGFVFGFLKEFMDPVHQEAVNKMMTMWINFAKTGDPNGSDGMVSAGVAWKPFSNSSQNVLDIRESGLNLDQFNESYVTVNYYSFLQRIDTVLDPNSGVIG